MVGFPQSGVCALSVQIRGDFERSAWAAKPIPGVAEATPLKTPGSLITLIDSGAAKDARFCIEGGFRL